MTDNNKTPMAKRVIAIIGIIALLSIYVILFVMAIIGTPFDYFMGAVVYMDMDLGFQQYKRKTYDRIA